MEYEPNPWTFIHNSEPSKDKEFWVWDEHLERLVKGMKWFPEIQDWGSSGEPWSGNFAFWMYPVDEAESIASPYRYTVEI